MTMGMWNDENGEKCLTKNTKLLLIVRIEERFTPIRVGHTK